MEIPTEVWGALAEASPYALILVIVFILFIIMYKIGINALKESSEAAIKEIKEAHREASMRLDTALQILNARR